MGCRAAPAVRTRGLRVRSPPPRLPRTTTPSLRHAPIPPRDTQPLGPPTAVVTGLPAPPPSKSDASASAALPAPESLSGFPWGGMKALLPLPQGMPPALPRPPPTGSPSSAPRWRAASGSGVPRRSRLSARESLLRSPPGPA